ncbi:uncharacterized protein LOC120684620 isoform X2 [Panicum virgatum]|uniref:uncharacterized protein LOC120684620 isoform X2 n=1 Tax=Panicum virgatum TaxID=38727 RepID=UPI0019D5059D|nr:uncharacterized protein LOC120684620 isoform X2 [Panicum virgatum]
MRPLARRPGQAAALGGAAPSQRTRGGRACWALLCSGGRGARLHVQPPCEQGGRARRGAQAAAANGGRGGGQPMAALLAAEWWPRPRWWAPPSLPLSPTAELRARGRPPVPPMPRPRRVRNIAAAPFLPQNGCQDRFPAYFAVENKVLLSHIELCLEDTSTTGLLGIKEKCWVF